MSRAPSAVPHIAVRIGGYAQMRVLQAKVVPASHRRRSVLARASYNSIPAPTAAGTARRARSTCELYQRSARPPRSTRPRCFPKHLILSEN